MNRFSCPHCGKHLSFSLDQFGKRIKCPKCLQPIHLGMAPKDNGSAKSLNGFITRERLQLAALFLLVTVATWMVWYTFF